MKTFMHFFLSTNGNDQQSLKNDKNIRWLHPDVSTSNFCAGSRGLAAKYQTRNLKRHLPVVRMVTTNEFLGRIKIMHRSK